MDLAAIPVFTQEKEAVVKEVQVRSSSTAGSSWLLSLSKARQNPSVPGRRVRYPPPTEDRSANACAFEYARDSEGPDGGEAASWALIC